MSCFKVSYTLMSDLFDEKLPKTLFVSLLKNQRKKITKLGYLVASCWPFLCYIDNPK